MDFTSKMNQIISNFVQNILLWDKYLQEFVPITPSINGTYDVKQSVNPEQQNLNGIPIRIAYEQTNQFMEFHDNDTKIGGYLGDMWNTIANHLNFTLIPVRMMSDSPNGSTHSWMDAVGMITRNETDIILSMRYNSKPIDIVDFSIPLFTSCFRAYSVENLQLDSSWLTKMISFGVFINIISFMILFSIMSHAFNCYYYWENPSLSDDMSFGDHFFCTFATFCNQDGLLPARVESQSRIMAITRRLLAWFFLVMISSDLWNLMSKRQDNDVILNIDSFFERTDHELMVQAAEDLFSEWYNRSLHSGRLRVVEDTNEIFNHSLLKTNKAVLWIPEYMYYTTGRESGLLPLSECSPKIAIAAVTGKEFPYNQAINIAILKLTESGIFNAIKMRWSSHVKIISSNEFLRVGIDEAYKIFLIWGLGVFLSFIILIVEMIKFDKKLDALRRKKNRQRRAFAKRLRVQMVP